MLHHRLSTDAAEAMAAGRLAESKVLRDVAAIRALSTRALQAELAEIAPLLDDPVVIKGPAVARHYPDPSRRTYVDLDLLLARERLEDAAATLSERGYERVVEFDTGFGAAHGHDIHMRRRVGTRRLDVELHWRVGDDPATECLDHGLLSREPGRLAPELLVLSAHLLGDRAKRLVWLRDLKLAAEGAGDEEWKDTFALAQELDLLWILHRALDYVEHHLGFERERPLPAGEPPPMGPLRAVEEIDARASLHVGRLAVMGARERAAYLRRILVPTRDGLRGTVGGDGAPMWRLVGRHMRAAAAALRPRR